jgi:glucan phosphoethanolaminetransferase (alkaline phosphatase superfamily)
LYNHDYGYIYNLRKKIGIIFPFTVVNSIKTIYDQDELIQATAKERNAFKFGSHLDSLVKGIQLHVLIIGESCRFDHWGLNGYYRNTSPHLSKRENLISFSQVASGSYMTEMSVPLLLTGVGAPNFDAHKNRKGVIGAFREAGFTTYWLTDQSDIGANIKIHSLEAEKQFYLISDFRSTKHLHQDLELLNMLREVLKSPEGKKFIVIHCIGSHYNYSSRYPDSYDLYQPSNKTVASKVTDRRYKDVLVNSYDNSILYSDAVIDSAISLVNSLDIFSSVTFVADHGEDLLDDDRDYTDHVHGSPPSKYVAHVPMFTWVSQKFEEAYPGKADYLLEHKQSPISTEDLMPTLCSMAGIFYHGQDSTRDFSSAAFLNSSQLLRGENGKIYSFSDMK